MKTKHKIAIAKTAYHTIRLCRRLVGAGQEVTVRRGGITYRLDLSEGIDLAIYLGQFEPATAAACARHIALGQTVLDIGANIGAHTLNLSRLVGENGAVFAFEPTEWAYLKLQRNLALNPELARRVTALQCFLGDGVARDLPDTIYSSWPLTSAKDLHPKHRGKAMATGHATKKSVDAILADYGNPSIHVVKMDVDGYECEVLAGARNTMSCDRPIFIMEFSPYVLTEHGASTDRLLSYFLPLEYRFYREADDAPLPYDPKSLAALVADGAGINIIARPS